MTELKGMKFDTDKKARYELIPPEALYELAKLYALGAKKYGDRNWEKGLTYSRVFGAMMRHAWAWFWGEKKDPIDGQHHLIAVAWNAFALYTYETRGLGKDDRPWTTEPEGPQTAETTEPLGQRLTTAVISPAFGARYYTEELQSKPFKGDVV